MKANEAPDNIYLFKNSNDIILGTWFLDSSEQFENIEYIRKDIVDEMLATAEDHAYFAGSESQRVKLEKIKDNFIKKACDAYCKVCKISNCRSDECKLIGDFRGHLETIQKESKV